METRGTKRMWLSATAFAMALALLVTLLAGVGRPPQAETVVSAPDTEASDRWVLQCVDCPKYSRGTSDVRVYCPPDYYDHAGE
jgi:hypothetical protein